MNIHYASIVQHNYNKRTKHQKARNDFLLSIIALSLSARSSQYPHNISFRKGNKMALEQKSQILQVAASGACGIRDLAHKLRWKTSTIVFLTKKMNEEKLITFRTAKHPSRGRPKKSIACTPLGVEFLKNYERLTMTPLKATKADFEHATRDAAYTQRLIENGHSPFELFMELNSIVRNIRNSSETHQTV
jgi:DNA-binding PadR family transcriptional regulator